MARTYVLLDRDGTIIYDRHYLSDPAAVELLPGAAEALRRLTDLGCGLIVVTNQSGIGRGYFDEPTLARIHERFEALLADESIRLDAIYYCPHTDEAACGCRKPLPGMAERAARDFGFDLARAFVVGDRHGDIDLARAVGAKGILVRTGVGGETEREARCAPHHTADDLTAAAAWIAEQIGERAGASPAAK
jgi:D-glycero-D-manno-heptose 1,7-bisphosphate phosphatase